MRGACSIAFWNSVTAWSIFSWMSYDSPIRMCTNGESGWAFRKLGKHFRRLVPDCLPPDTAFTSANSGRSSPGIFEVTYSSSGCASCGRFNISA